MKKIAHLVLGIITSIGGFVEVGSISTAAQAGAEFGLHLLWAIAAAAFILALLTEMCGRLAAVSGQTLASAVRERFGFHFQLVLLGAELVLDFLLLSAELGGAAIALQLVTGVDFRWWLVPVAVVGWTILWFGSFAVIEDGLGFLGLITLVFVVAAWRLRPPAAAIASGFVPSLPDHDFARYGFFAISIVGATVSPYLLNFYSSGAVEEGWGEDDLFSNRVTAYVGMGFGAVVSMGVLVAAALVLGPRHIRVDSYEQAALMFLPAFGHHAVQLFAAGLGVGCLGASVEISLNAGYVFAQGFGWPWGADKNRLETARFSAAMTLMLLASLAFALIGFDPLRVTLISVALTVIVLPILVLPILVLMNDERLVKSYRSGRVGNALLATLCIVAAALALIVVPFEVMGG